MKASNAVAAAETALAEAVKARDTAHAESEEAQAKLSQLRAELAVHGKVGFKGSSAAFPPARCKARHLPAFLSPPSLRHIYHLKSPGMPCLILPT